MREYMQVLIWTMLFVIVVEMIFPASEFKKYLKLILGFIIVYTIFTPVVKGGFWNEGKYDEYVKYYQEQVGDLQHTNLKLQEYEEELLGAYKEQEVNKIALKLKKQLNLEVVDSDIVFDTTGYTPTIQEITLNVVKEKKKEKISIPQIKIGEKDKSLSLDQDNLKKEIKNCLGDFYNWDNVNINIIVQDN